MKQAELSANEKQQLLTGLKQELIELEQQLEHAHERSAPVMLDQQAVGRVSQINTQTTWKYRIQWEFNAL
ncbi:MAG: DnaK suppressor protein [Shewanella sp.]